MKRRSMSMKTEMRKRQLRHFPILLVTAIASALAGAPVARAAAPLPSPRTILIFGDSLTAGYGLENPDDAYPAVLQRRIDAAQLPWRVVNAGLSGETTAGGLRRIDWLLQNPIDLFILALGGNDGLRGVDPDETRHNLEGILEKVHRRYPRAPLVVAAMQMPPNLGLGYTRRFRAVFPLAAKAHHAALIPFLLEGVADAPELNQDDLIHPNAEGQRHVADNVWRVLEPLLQASSR
jgi:acyl-CoA thioesterase I